VSVVVENLTVRYGSLTAVDNVSFTAPTGSVTVILGPNGAGKTSTIEVCEGFRTAASGSVRVLGLDPTKDHAQLTRRMGVMLQGGGVYPSARVKDVVGHFCALYGKGVSAVDLIERVGLTDRAKSTWRRLSGGEQQRLSLALALAARPEVAFLDEPTSGVDVEGRDAIRDIITELAAAGTTVVLASHDMAEAEKMATHAVLFRAGHVVAAGMITELLGVRKRLRFTSTPDIDVVQLGTSVGSPAHHLGNGTYEIAAESSPRLVARISQWLAEQQLPLHAIDTGSESLEDAYRRLAGRES
jgi:ABC-2 type transport system ATP-binding protein